MFPVMLDLRDRPCLVVGAGTIAHRKLLQLLAEGAAVKVVAPAAIEPITRLAAAGKIALLSRRFVVSDLEGCQLVLVATNDRAVDEHVTDAARAKGIWVNVADVPELCDLHLPARLRRGDLQLSFASAGGAPFAVRRLRDLFERKLGSAWAEWLAVAKRFRKRVYARGLASEVRDQCYDRFVQSSVDEATLSVRIPSERELEAWSDPAAAPEPRTGRVALVGAGPGNPGLVTALGLRRLREADAVVYDRLAIPAIPLDLPDSVELHSVGKEAGSHPVPQDQINALLVRLARMGKRVVRLKGGDPFVFARGGEEVLVLRQEGIPCEVIPGVTAGIAVPASAGIPVTFRGEAVRLTFVTAHEGGAAPQVRWDLLAQDAHATLVGYMGVSTLAEVSAALIAAGMTPEMPAAVIEQGTLPRQRSVRAKLADLAAVAAASGIKPPAIFVIGQVVAHAEALGCQDERPLKGTRFALLSPPCELSDALAEAGAEALFAPTPITAAARLVIGSAPLSGWILRSPEELEILGRERERGEAVAQSPLWCVGAELAGLARQRGFDTVAELDGAASMQAMVAQLQQGIALT